MSSSDERTRLGDIIENIDQIGTYVGQRDRAAFAADRLIVDGTERCLERVIEATIKIGAERMAKIAPGLPIHELRGLGNIMRHGYDTVSTDVILGIVRNDLPSLRVACVAALER